jgi:hypothetical protein
MSRRRRRRFGPRRRYLLWIAVLSVLTGAALIVSLLQVTRAPQRTPFRFPTPVDSLHATPQP